MWASNCVPVGIENKKFPVEVKYEADCMPATIINISVRAPLFEGDVCVMWAKSHRDVFVGKVVHIRTETLKMRYLCA